MDESNLLIDAVLNTYPLSPTPPDFTARVMAEVQKSRQQPQAKPAFRLEFVDFAVPIFFSIFIAGMLVLNLVAVFSMDTLTRMELALQIKVVLVRLMALSNQIATFSFPVTIWLPVAATAITSLMGLLIALILWSIQHPVRLAWK